MLGIAIKKVKTNEVELLQEVSKTTFYETFAADNTPENMQKYLDESFSVKCLREELLDEFSEFYFARVNGELAGYLKLNFGASQTELKDSKAIEIERIYVLKAFQGKRVGQALYEYALQVARDRGVDYIWLGVWEQNHKAIRFYEKNGFVAFDKHLFVLGDDLQTDIMMKLKL
ncbi:GNAT family N-acetyltransferase [Riemerella anatipestifer]|uniref:GNAT family N-acetyltransferase n=1 Tax=Riemerella anatipestifer TaxID=34085 RepID=A0A1A5HJ33_RIEAN|nr:GNAT family N-acetyltransferase [Riemerella anatipestifer]AQY22223.1 Protease synthase and sporulation negative regulatory protein PAI 1 [Riemerella anatipestifer]AZZ59248.1 GNAT family N-acetyltransferase [Riemerella anatipestifer]MBT0551290.1 GNAT family N-acetyltransferase [Riemerella anatipestifer]MBT0554666.1 GNAT family N-acetyltransferase [Riemerella anatipestifer]MBT0573064.1 GNAT family N-acetyltransferase [Riemerella anatipestifer]